MALHRSILLIDDWRLIELLFILFSRVRPRSSTMGYYAIKDITQIRPQACRRQSLPSLSRACVASSAVLSWCSLGCLLFPALGLCVVLRAVACTTVACVMSFSHHCSRIRDQVAMGVLWAGGFSSPARTPIGFYFPALPYPLLLFIEVGVLRGRPS